MLNVERYKNYRVIICLHSKNKYNYTFQHLTWNFDNIVLEILFFAFVLGTVSWFKSEVDKLEYSKEVLGSLLLLFDKMLRDNKLGIRTKGLPWWLRQ